MKFIDKHSYFTDYCYKTYTFIEKTKYTIFTWRKSIYNYGFGFFIILPYSSFHRKINNLKAFNKFWNENFTNEKSYLLEENSYHLNHKEFENYLKEKVVNLI